MPLPAVRLRVLILSWEYPPIVEGGLARHVRKLSEQLVRDGVEVHVLTRGGGRLAAREDRHGVIVHRVREPDFPKDDLDAFIAWVERMNDDMRAAGRRAGGGWTSTWCTRTTGWWPTPRGGSRRASRRRGSSPCTRPSTGATRAGSTSTRSRTSTASSARMVRAADRVITCSHYMRGHVADVFGIPAGRVTVIPNGIDPSDLQPVADLPRLRAQFAEPEERLVLLVGRLVYEKGFHLALDALPGLIRRARRRALPRRRLGHRGGRAQGAGAPPRADAPRHVHGLDRRRRPALAVPDRRPVRGAVDLRAVRARGARGDGLGLSVRRRRHRRPARGRPRRAAASGCASARATRARSRGWREKLLTDDALRERLVAEAGEHVLRFDWADVARQTAAVYAELDTARV